MKINHFVYINNSPTSVGVEYKILNKSTGETTVIHQVLRSKGVINDTTAKLNVGFNKNIEVLDAVIVNPDGTKHSAMHVDALGSAQKILKHSVIADIETLGKASGQAITQLGFYDVGTGKGTMIVAQPQLIHAPPEADLRFQSRLGKYADLPPGTNFKAIKYAQVIQGMDNVDFDTALKKYQGLDAAALRKVEEHFVETDTFQARYFVKEDVLREGFEAKYGYSPAVAQSKVEELRPIRAFHQALDASMKPEQVESLLVSSRGEAASLRNLFTEFDLITDRSMRDILTSDMPDLLRGKVTWIANASFESTQFGAQIDTMARESMEALNTMRVASGYDEISEKAFMGRFAYGGYEAEIEAINKIQGRDLLTKSPMYGVVSGVSASSGKPFYVTGQEYTTARSAAYKTGDWSGLYDVFLKTTGKGDVRDVLDLVRMQQSMLIKGGLLQSSDKPSSLGVEVQARLFGVTESLRLAEESGKGADLDLAMKRIFEKELHVGIGDVRLSELPILKESLDQLEALRIVSEGGAPAQDLIRQASLGKGALYRATIYGQLMDKMNRPFVDESGKNIDSLHDVMLRQRGGRYAEDLVDQGFYQKRTYDGGYTYARQARKVGDATVTELVPLPRSKKVERSNFFHILEDLREIQDYKSADTDRVLREFEEKFKGTYDTDTGEITDRKAFKKLAQRYAESAGDQIKSIEERFRVSGGLEEITSSIKRTQILSGKELSKKLSGVKPPKLSTLSKEAVGEAFERVSKGLGKFKKGYLAAAGVFLGASFLPKEKKKNLFVGNYDDFLIKKSEESGLSKEDYINALKTKYNNIEGMSESGLSSFLRKRFTDFGSPYESPRYSLSVLDNHNLRRERERYMAAQFGARHFSSQGDIGFFLKRFVDSMFRKEMGFSKIPPVLPGGGSPITAGKYNSLKGDGLVEYKINANAKIDVTDADTITINNFNSNVRSKSIFGNPNEMKIRLAGIDAPETAHQGRAAQPFAEEAKRIASEMISKAKDVRVVTQKGDSTYGRQVAMVYADGINVNLELLKRGAAAYLPYKGKSKPQIYNQRAFEEAQERAYESKRGMWRESYFQAYKMITDISNQSVTFNTLVNNSKIAKNGNLMSMRALMDQAQEMGINNELNLEIASVGKDISGMDKPFSPDRGKNSWSRTDLQTYGRHENTITSILDKQKYQIGALMRTRGSVNQSQKNQTSRVAGKNVELTNETLASKRYSEENAAKQNINKKLQQLKLKRLKTMEYLQQNALRNQFNSPIGHHRM